METKNRIFLLLIIICLSSCTKSMNELGRTPSKLIPKMKQGDVEAYQDLRILYLDRSAEDFIPIAKYMADSINYQPANLDVVQKYLEKNNLFYPDDSIVNLLKINEYDRKEILKYYERAKSYKVKGIEDYNFKSE